MCSTRYGCERRGRKKCSCVVKIHCKVNSTHSSIMQILLLIYIFYYDNIYVWMKMKGDVRVHGSTKAQSIVESTSARKKIYFPRHISFISFIFMSFKWAIYCVCMCPCVCLSYFYIMLQHINNFFLRKPIKKNETFENIQNAIKILLWALSNSAVTLETTLEAFRCHVSVEVLLLKLFMLF